MRLLLILVLLSAPVSADILINEIMPDPIADESLNEWVELYNNGAQPVDLNGWSIGDNSDLDKIGGGLYNGEGTIIPPKGYAIVTDDSTRVYNNFNVSPHAIKLYVEDSSIGNGLKNTGETLYLYNNTLLQNISYPQSETGKSLAWINNTWKIADPTPGSPNNGILYQEEIINTTYCDWKIEILLNDTLYEQDYFEFKVKATNLKTGKTNITGRLSITDFFQNTIKEYKPWTNKTSTSKATSSTYTPNLQKGKAYMLNASLFTQCNDSKLNNNNAVKLFAINSPSQSSTSHLSIENIYDLGTDNIAKFGQTIRVKAQIYKGATTKNSIALWVAEGSTRISKESKTNVYSTFTNYTLTLPVQLKPNCDLGYKDGDYTIYLEGLDIQTTKELRVQDITNSMCEEVIIEKKSTSGKFTYKIVEYRPTLLSGQKTTIKVKLDNEAEDGFPVEVWSYIYKGKKSYSGERELNKKVFYLDGKSSVIVDLENQVTGITPGDYKLKVLINKDGQKTNKEITKEVTVIEPKSINQVQSLTTEPPETVNPIELELQKETVEHIYTTYKIPKTIYESKDQESKKLIPNFLILTLTILTLILIFIKIQ